MNHYKELKKRFCEGVFKGEKSKKKAIENAYADMSRRATGHKPYMKENCVNWLLDEVFKSTLSFETQEDFDNWHKNTCNGLKERLGDFGTVGRAQKVINMAFKYLSCVDDTYDNVLQYCHMTLDGYTLNWYKMIAPKGESKTIPTWSKIKNYEKEYFPIQEKIRKSLKESQEYSVVIGKSETKPLEISNIPFEAEFVIWEGEIIKTKYNALIKELSDYRSKGKERDGWLIGNLVDSCL